MSAAHKWVSGGIADDQYTPPATGLSKTSHKVVSQASQAPASLVAAWQVLLANSTKKVRGGAGGEGGNLTQYELIARRGMDVQVLH